MIAYSYNASGFGSVQSLYVFVPGACGLNRTAHLPGPTALDTASKTSNNKRQRFSIDPPYLSVRWLDPEFKNWSIKYNNINY